MLSMLMACGAVEFERSFIGTQALKRIILVLVFSTTAVANSLFFQEVHAQIISGMAPVGPGGSYQIHYESQGDGEPVVMIHGYSLDRRMWDAQFESLATDYQVIRYDMIGHGLSSGATGTVHSWKNLRDLLNFLDVDRAHVVGHSMGSSVAVDFAIEFPERTMSLVTVGGFPSDYYWDRSSGQFWDRLTDDWDISQSQGLLPALEQWVADPLFAQAMALPEVRSKLEEIVLEGHTALGTGAAFLWPNITRFASPQPGVSSRLADIQAPTRIALGELDLPDFHNAGNIMMQGIPGAQEILIPEAGHMLPMEKPAETNQMLTDFYNVLNADIDDDSDVDGADFLMWQRGESPNPLSLSDLSNWQAKFGTVLGPMTDASVAVPEPATGLMLILGIAVILFRTTGKNVAETIS